MKAIARKLSSERFVRIIVVAITVIGFLLRFACCFWGLPLLIHPDEYAVVEPAIDMLARNSWEANSYARPDQLEVKIDAILFQVFSWLVYHLPPEEAFPDHNVGFYFVARCTTVAFGTALIPLCAALCGRIANLSVPGKALARIFGALFAAFPALFIMHSAYATPDIPLTFFCVLFAWFFLAALSEYRRRDLFACAATIGASVTIKYPAAILLIPFAFLLAYQLVQKRISVKETIRSALASILIMLLVVFLIAPNIFTNIGRFTQSFASQGTPGHLGADGLGFFGNILFYIQTDLTVFGLLSIVPLGFGVVHLCRKNPRGAWTMSIGLVFLICMSVISLHWARWMIPFFAFYGMVVSVGIAALFARVHALSKRTSTSLALRRACWAASWVIVVVLVANAVLSACAAVRFTLLPDTRQIAAEYCKEHGITAKNSLRDMRTPLAPGVRNVKFEGYVDVDEAGTAYLTEKGAGYEYLIVSSSRWDRYKAEPDRYASEISLYEGIDETYELMWHIDGRQYESKMFALQNIAYDLGIIFGEPSPTGYGIWVYRLVGDVS